MIYTRKNPYILSHFLAPLLHNVLCALYEMWSLLVETVFLVGLSDEGCFSSTPDIAQNLEVRLGALHNPHNHLESISSFFLQKSCHFKSICHQALPFIILPCCSHLSLSFASLITEDLVSNSLSYYLPLLLHCQHHTTTLHFLHSATVLPLSTTYTHQCHGHHPTPQPLFFPVLYYLNSSFFLHPTSATHYHGSYIRPCFY